MKVGAVTFHSAFNFGASLQTWALQQTLKACGVSPCLVHYHPPALDRLYDPIKVSAPLARFVQRMKLKRQHPERLERYRRYREFIATHFNLLGDFSDYEQLTQAKWDLDACIVGSDQVWNVAHTKGYDPAYFLEFLPDTTKRIAYAASVGRDFIFPKYHEPMREGLRRFSAVSVREESIRDTVRHLYDGDVAVTLDPTLLLERHQYDALLKQPCTRPEPYILVYMMENNKALIRLTNRISRSVGLPVIQRRPSKMFQHEIENFFTATPGEFLSLLEGATYVITNSFHGTVFAIIYEKPFFSMLHSNTGSRTANLLTTLGLEKHLLTTPDDFRGFDRFRLEDPAATQRRIQELRADSMRFLTTALGLPPTAAPHHDATHSIAR